MGVSTPPELQDLTDVEFHARLLQFHVELASQGTAFDRYVGVEVLAGRAVVAEHARRL